MAEIDQILVRPKDDRVIVQWTDNAGRSDQRMLTGPEIPEVTRDAMTALVVEAETLLPDENPEVLTPLEQEIRDTEYRLEQLRRQLDEQKAKPKDTQNDVG